MNKKQLFTGIVFYILILLVQPKKYYMWYPTIPLYPDNNKEIEFMIKKYISKRTQDDIDLFYLTDKNPVSGFEFKITENQYKTLRTTIRSENIVREIRLYKYMFNRARPSQVAPEKINSIKLLSDDSPSYPSGHAYQSFYAAKLLTKWEPARKKEWDEIAERTSYIRVYMGIHYPSDVEFSRSLVNRLKM